VLAGLELRYKICSAEFYLSFPESLVRHWTPRPLTQGPESWVFQASLKNMTILGKERDVLKTGQNIYTQIQMTVWLPQPVRKRTTIQGNDSVIDRLGVFCQVSCLHWRALCHNPKHLIVICHGGKTHQALLQELLSETLLWAALNSVLVRYHQSHKIKIPVKNLLRTPWRCNLGSFAYSWIDSLKKRQYKISLFADDMILYLKDPKNSTQKLLDIIYSYSKIAG
jgi:hypothetical protein